MFGLLKRLTSSSSDSNLSRVVSGKNSSTSSPARREPFPIVEVSVPSRSSLPSSGSRTPTPSIRSPASERSSTPQHTKGYPVTNGHGSPHRPERRSPDPMPTPKHRTENFPSPKRARFDEHTSEKPKSTIQNTQTLPEPCRELSSRPSSANGRPSSGPTRPTKRKRTSEEEEGDKSAELEVAPYIASRLSKVPKHSTSPGAPFEHAIAMPSFSKKGADSRRNSSLSRPSPRPSSSTSRITFEISDSDSDEGNDSDSIQKDASPELPEVPPLSSPRKTHHKIDIKGKGRAIEPSGPNTSSSTDTTTLDKPKPFPLEAGFHSLDDLANWTDRTTRPPYSLWVLIRCAILGSGIDQLVLEGILSRICNKYPFYQDQVRKSQEERSKLEAALKAAIASKQCFVINRDDRTNVRYGVDKHINPISRRLPAGKKYETGSEGKSTINVKTQTSSVPRVEGTASKGMSPVPPTKPAPPAPPPKEPEYEPVQPDKLPKADLDIFATSLLDLKNAAPPGEEENNDAANLASAKQSTTVNGSETSTIPAARGSYIAMVRKVIPYDLYVPIRAAILGSPYRKLKLKQIVDDLVWKYPQLDPKEEPESRKKLQQAVVSMMMGRPCFFRLHETRVRESVWMVDPSIDPREKKKKFKWGPISRKDEASTIQPVYFESLGLTLNVHVPPSVASRVNDKPAEFDKMSPEALALDFEHVLRDLKDMETFYRERKEKWNRRMAYLHESAKMVLVQPPQSDEIPSDIQVSGNEDDMPSKEPSPELEEIVSPRKPGVKANGMSKKAHPLAKQIFHDDIVDSSDEEEEVAPVKVVTPAPSYVCGYADSRTGIICETRLASREERETHRRFVHSVRNNEFSAQSRFAQEAKQKMKKQLEQERVDKKLQGKKRKSKGDSDGDGVSILAVVAMHSKFKQQSVPETRK